jgi:hypothetical protein
MIKLILRLTLLLTAHLATEIVGRAAIIVDSFKTNPLHESWRITGDSSLFQWNETTQSVEVKWDSSRSNSFFWRSLGTVLTKADDFGVSFSLRIHDIQIGATPDKPLEFPIAIGFLHRNLLTNVSVFRGAGASSTRGVRNIVEWNFFPDGGFGDTWATTVISSNNVFAYSHTFPLALVPNSLYRITLRYTAGNGLLQTTATRDGQSVGVFEDVLLVSLPDFRLDTFSITSYSDLFQATSPAFDGSVLARGSVDEIMLTVPSPPVTNLQVLVDENGLNVSFNSHTNWIYTLERSSDLLQWNPASAAVPGLGFPVTMQDTGISNSFAFYRVRADRP